MSQSEFARNQLLKHGWKEGSGLGREEGGMKEAIKVKVKNNKTGVGHDPGEEFTNHWWQDMFNKTASSIQVEASQDGSVTVRRKEAANKKKNTTSKSVLYGNFVKGATLKQECGRCVEEVDQLTSSSSEQEDLEVLKQSEEQLFEECGGRTAHKGARHGMGLNGKLQRIIAMEQKLSLQMTTPNQAKSIKRKVKHDALQNLDVTEDNKRKKTKSDLQEASLNDSSDKESPNMYICEMKKKKKKKKKKKLEGRD